MGTLVGGGVGQSSTQGQAGVLDPAAFAPASVGTGPIASGIQNTAQQTVDTYAEVRADQHLDQTSTQQGYGGDAIGGDVTAVGSGNTTIVND